MSAMSARQVAQLSQDTNDIGTDVLIKMKESRTELLQAGLTIARFDQSIFWALTPAQFEVVTVMALLR